MKTRLEWIDIAKCLAIILVVLGHATGASIVGKYIYCFHMPLFFIISGMCFTNGKYKIKNFVKKRFKQLFLPAVWLTFISVIIIKLANHPYELSSLGDALPGALWFLPVLFFVEVIYCLFSNCSLLIRGGYLICFMILGIVFSKTDLHLPYSLQSIPAAIVYYGIGNIMSCRRIYDVSDKFGLYKIPLLLGLLILPIARIIIYPHHLYMFENNIEWVDFIVAPLASFAILQLAILMECFQKTMKLVLLWIGNNTMMIMAIHLPVLYIVSDYRFLFDSYIVYKLFEEFAMWSVSFIFVVIANRFCPFIVGKEQRK